MRPPNPAETDYLFYVLTSKDGSQTFTTNYADHLKAVAKYRRVFGIKYQPHGVEPPQGFR